MRQDTVGGPATPEWALIMCALYGTNPLGEPVFRVVHSKRRVSLIGGYWENDHTFGYRLRPKYSKIGYILERWLHARNYGSPETWTEATITPDGHLACGRYPDSGLYECCFVFDDVPLRPDTLGGVLHAIYAGRIRTVPEIRRALEDEARHDEAEWDAMFERQWDESHGVRRGLSFNAGGVLQNSSDEIEQYKARLVASPVKVRREDFKSGFEQGEIRHG